MRLNRLRIRNFRNFRDIDISLAGNVVLLGANRVGKSNLLFAIRLILDPTLSDASRQLKLSDFWDGCACVETSSIEIHLDFSEFDKDDAELALLTDFRVPEDHNIARLSYVFRKKDDTGDDYEFIVYGGDNERNFIPNKVRRRIALDMLDALRDAESQLASWRNSPLRPLLEDAMCSLDSALLQSITLQLNSATKSLEELPKVKSLEDKIRSGINTLAGSTYDIKARLRFAASDPLRLFRSLGIFIDEGKRNITEASLGSANVALIALKLSEFEWRRTKNERNYSLLCIEEPEAHLHPHLQRSMFEEIFRNTDSRQALIVTSHSPTLASVVPLRTIVHLKQQDGETKAYSLAKLPVSDQEFADIEKYLNATRSELLFSRGVIFVEGDAEEVLVPEFARNLGYNLNHLGITVCSVAGVNFNPYVKLATGLGLPFSIITDWDPLDGSKAPLGKFRTFSIWNAYTSVSGQDLLPGIKQKELEDMNDIEFIEHCRECGVFLNEQTFEVSMLKTPDLKDILLQTLLKLDISLPNKEIIAKWLKGEPPNTKKLLKMADNVGKGRLSTELKRELQSANYQPPVYIAAAIRYVVNRV